MTMTTIIAIAYVILRYVYWFCSFFPLPDYRLCDAFFFWALS